MSFSQSPVTVFASSLDSAANEHGWTAVIATGFSRDVLSACAKGFGVTEKALIAAFAFNVPTKKAAPLDFAASEKLARVAVVSKILACEKGLTAAQCWDWLTKPCAAIRNRIPAELVGSAVGTEYAVTAASRI